MFFNKNIFKSHFVLQCIIKPSVSHEPFSSAILTGIILSCRTKALPYSQYMKYVIQQKSYTEAFSMTK